MSGYAYSRQSWVNGSAGGTPLSAARLNHIEDGLVAGGKVPLGVYSEVAEPGVYPGVTVTVSSAAPSWTIAKYFDPGTYGARYKVVGPSLVKSGSLYYAMWNGITNGVVPHEEAMWCKGPDVAIQVQTFGSVDFQILVDGMMVKPSFTQFGAAGTYFVILNFTDDTSVNRVRNIRFLAGSMAVGQWLFPGTGDMWPDNSRRYTFGVVAADSYFAGSGSTTEGVISAGAALPLTVLTGGKAQLIAAGAQGGTGYVNAGNGDATTPGPGGSTAYGSSARLAQVATWISQADCLVIAGGANDATFTTATVVAAAEAAWTAYAALAPGKPLIVFGPQSGVYASASTALTALNNALKAAAANHPEVTAYIDERGYGLFSGTGNIDAQVGDGNLDVFMSSDGIHLSRSGFNHLARWRLQQIAGIRVPAI